MATRRILIVALAFFSITAGINAQTPTQQTTTGAKKVMDTTTITGTVDTVDGNWLVVKLEPSGKYQFFNVPPGRQFIIDGQPKMISDLKRGTVLTATVTTTAQTVTERTTTVKTGTVWYVSGNYVILTLPNGENQDYTVPPSYKFVVEGKPASVSDLRKGMKVSATKIVEEPRTQFATTTTVTGKSPK